jgi:hypothetical protein
MDLSTLATLYHFFFLGTMPGFITNHFAAIEKHLLHEMRSAKKKSELPSTILCHSSTEIEYLKRFFSGHRCAFNDFYFYTFDAFMGEFLNKFSPECHAVNITDLEFLANNKQIYLKPRVLLQFFREENFTNRQKISPDTFAALQPLWQQVQALKWKIPQQALKKIVTNAPKLYAKCILFGLPSEDNYYIFLKLLQKITDNVTFFAFDCGNSESGSFEVFEEFFGPAENIGGDILEKPSQIHFTIVDDSIDAAMHIRQLILSQEIQRKVIGVVCLSQSFATLVAHNLDAAQIPFHSGFPTPIFTLRDNFIFAWRQWQMKNDPDSFVNFGNFLQYFEPSLFPQGIDINEVLTKIFDDYPVMRAQDLADLSGNSYLKNMLDRYPMLPENGSFHDFYQKTSPIFPEIAKIEKYFPQDFPVAKKAFLDYVFHLYVESKPSIDQSNSATIFLLDPPSAVYLQFDEIIVFFQNISNHTSITISSLRAKKVHCIALKSNIHQEFIACYQTYTGKFLDANAMQHMTKYFPSEEISQNHRKQYDFLKKIHQVRNDKNSSFGAFEYTIPEIQSYSLPITAIERAYSEPEEIWYRHILKNDPHPLLFEKSKFEGILTHKFLHWPSENFPSFEQFQQYIASQKQCFCRKFVGILSQILLQETLESAEKKASIIVKKLTAFEDFPFIISEVNLHAPTTLPDGISIPLHGRIDCILSQYPIRKTFHEDNAPNNVLLIDFKTGTTSQSDLQKLVKKFINLPSSLSGLQLLLFGLMLRTLGYRNIQLLILNGDPYDHAEPLRLETIIAGENFQFIQKYLKTLLIDGIFGYGELHPFGKTHFHPPIATLRPNAKAIQGKRQQFFL